MIPFPEGIRPDIFTISLGSFTITLYWYAVAYILGIVACWRLAAYALKTNELWQKNTPPLNPIKLEDLMSYCVLGIIIGGRLGFVIFYNPEYYLKNLLEVFYVWQGGMSFHGALIGIIVVTYIFSKKRNLKSLFFWM